MTQVNVQKNGAVTVVRSDELVRLFSTSDVHFDSPTCNRHMFFLDMNTTVALGAQIVILGDLVDAMQGRFDPRRSMDSVRPEYRYEDYYDRIVFDVVNQLIPYAHSILMLSRGNHEVAVLKNANTDLLARVVDGLNKLTGSSIVLGEYGGTLDIECDYRVRVKYFHGAGGDAPVTRGVIQTNRQSVFLPDVDVVVNGHSHNSYWVPIARERVEGGILKFDVQHHIRTPGYSQTYGDGTRGWEVSRGGVPKPLGGCYITMIGETEKVSILPVCHPPEPVNVESDVYSGPEYPQD